MSLDQIIDKAYELVYSYYRSIGIDPYTVDTYPALNATINLLKEKHNIS